MRYYTVPKTCDIYNYGYSYNDGSGVTNCINIGEIKELVQKGESEEDYMACKADVHGEGWWGECDSGCSDGGDKRKCDQPRDTDSESGSHRHTDCRPGIVTNGISFCFLLSTKDIFLHE